MDAVLSRSEARAFDRHAIQTYGIAGSLLMENAGAGVAQYILKSYSKYLPSVLVVGGLGQNGGDAWVVARHLYSAGVRTRVVVLGAASAISGDALPNWNALKRIGIPTLEVSSEAHVEAQTALLDETTLIVDGIFGTGLNRAATGIQAAYIDAINRRDVPVISLDIPSGVCADTGQVLGTAVRADSCCTFVAPKRGLLVWPGAEHCGHLHSVSLGAPQPSPIGRHSEGLREPSTAGAYHFTSPDILKFLIQRNGNAHKGRTGKTLICAGSPQKEGAAALSGLGALRGGAGLVKVIGFGVEGRLAPYPELMVQSLSPQESGNPNALTELFKNAAKRAQSIVIGPGFGLGQHAEDIVWSLLESSTLPMVVDADALRCIARQDLQKLRGLPGLRILTPHPGEAAALLHCSVADIEEDRFGAAEKLAEESGQVVVLKGAGTLVAQRGNATIVASGATPLLAVGGSGDVLAGLLGALFADANQPKNTITCALAVRAHYEAALRCSDAQDFPRERGVLASEIAEALPTVLRRQVGRR